MRLNLPNINRYVTLRDGIRYNMLDYLDRVRKAGLDRWRAPCPVHNGKDRNLAITLKPDGTYVAYCHVCGCNQNDVAQTLRIPLQEIYPDYRKPEKNSRPVYPAGNYRGKEQMIFDRNLIEIYESDTGQKTYSDYKVYKESKARFDTYNKNMREWING